MAQFENYIEENDTLFEMFINKYGSELKQIMDKLKTDKNSDEIIEIKEYALYAITDIPKYTFITHYPCHFKCDEEFYMMHLFEPFVKGGKWGQIALKIYADKYNTPDHPVNQLTDEMFKKLNEVLAQDIINDFIKNALFSQKLVHPFINHDINACGHLCRESYPEFDIKKNNLQHEAMNYSYKSFTRANCIVTEVGLIAIKDIKKGEELRCSKGAYHYLMKNDIDLSSVYTETVINFITKNCLNYNQDDV